MQSLVIKQLTLFRFLYSVIIWCLAGLLALGFFFRCTFAFLLYVGTWHFTQECHLMHQNGKILVFILLSLTLPWLIFSFFLLLWATWILFWSFHLRRNLTQMVYKIQNTKYFKQYEGVLNGIHDNIASKKLLAWTPSEEAVACYAVGCPVKTLWLGPSQLWYSGLNVRTKNFSVLLEPFWLIIELI